MTIARETSIPKTDQVRAALREGRDIDALRVAKGFRHLGPHKATIQRGWDAHAHPSFARSLGRDPEALVGAAIAALRSLYGPGQSPSEVSISLASDRQLR